MAEPITAAGSDARRISLTAEDGVPLSGRYWSAGAGRPTGAARASGLGYVVCHGFTGSSESPAVQAICDRLHGWGAGVVAVDFRGHGSSGGCSTVGVAEEFDLAAAVGFLGAEGYSRICVAGWSMGASVVVRYAARRGHVAAAVSVSGPGLWYERGTRSMRRLHLATETRLGRYVLGRSRRTLVGSEGWEELPESPVELAVRIAPIPFLVVHGDADPYFPLRHARALAAAAPGSELWIEAGMGHAEKSTTPELVDRIDAWVRRATMTR